MKSREVWKDVVGFPYYRVSDGGVIESRKGATPRLLKIGFDSTGYALVVLCKDAKRFTKRVHRLVLEAFIGSCPDGYETNHKDGIKKNNSVKNLEWIKHVDNIGHAFEKGLLSRVGEKNSQAKLKETDVLSIKEYLHKGLTQMEIAKMFNISRGSIADIKKGRCWSHIVFEPASIQKLLEIGRR